MNKEDISAGTFIRVKGENTRYLILKKNEEDVICIRTYNRDSKKWYINVYQFSEILEVNTPTIGKAHYREAVENFFEKRGNFYFDNLTYVEILGKLLD